MSVIKLYKDSKKSGLHPQGFGSLQLLISFWAYLISLSTYPTTYLLISTTLTTNTSASIDHSP